MSFQYQIIKERIGAGTYASVYKVQRKIDKQILVLKKIPFYLNENKANIEDAKNEARILKQLEYKYIVKCFDSFEENNSLNIVMEYCEKGDLATLLKDYKQKNKYLPENLIWKFFIQISLGLAYIHYHKILHRDLKTLNIFLTKNLDIKIGDLGVAKILQNTLHAYTFIGTPFYLSPEICEEKPYNEKSDVWALGCVLYELCTYKHPYNAKNQPALFLKIISGNYEPIGDNYNYSNDLKKMVDSLLEKNYMNRPSMKDIIIKNIFMEKANKLGLYSEVLDIINLYDNQKINDKNYRSKKIQKITYIRPEKRKNSNPNNNIIKKKINEMYNNNEYLNNLNFCNNNLNYHEVNRSNEINKRLVNSGLFKGKIENKKEKKKNPSIVNFFSFDYSNNDKKNDILKKQVNNINIVRNKNSDKIKKNYYSNNNNYNYKHIVNKSSGGFDEIVKKNSFNNNFKIQKPIKQISNIKKILNNINCPQSPKSRINSSRSKERKINYIHKVKSNKEKPSLDLLYNELLPESNVLEMKIHQKLNMNKNYLKNDISSSKITQNENKQNFKNNELFRRNYNIKSKSKSKSRSTSKSTEKQIKKSKDRKSNNNQNQNKFDNTGLKKFINKSKEKSKSKDSNNSNLVYDKNIFKNKSIENPLNDFINDINKKTLETTNKISKYQNKELSKYENIPLQINKNIDDDNFEIIDSDKGKLIFDNSLNISDNDEASHRQNNGFLFKFNNSDDENSSNKSFEDEKVSIIQNIHNDINMEKRKKLISQIEKFQKKFNSLYQEFWSYDKQINCKKFMEIYKEIDYKQKGDKTEEVINKLEEYVRKHLSDSLAQQFKEIFYKFLYYDIELKITKNELEKIPNKYN